MVFDACRSDKESSAHSRVTATNSANYLDIRAVTANMETRGYHHSPGQPVHVQHVKDESRDSMGSRSSGHGSLDGQGSENFAARTDTMSSEGFVSGDDRHSRNPAAATKDHAYGKGTSCQCNDGDKFNSENLTTMGLHSHSCIVASVRESHVEAHPRVENSVHKVSGEGKNIKATATHTAPKSKQI